ncbi:MAG: alpha/beta hydrolase [Candidatus Thiosymbion ectosymbiont of Robbea hypermnestra]|nr:alpha/beta hydrolase [Candidatus Thiosymbion ectosymbiont of Robbea hypermnestra]
MLPSTLGMWLRNPALTTQALLLQAFGPRTASAAATYKMLFADGPPPESVKRHFARGAAEPPRVGFDLLWPDLPGPTWKRDRPLLVLGAEKDFFISPTMVEATARVYGTQAEIIPGLAHAMMLESGWQTVADRILRWLQQTLGGNGVRS